MQLNISVTEYAEKHGLSRSRVLALIDADRLRPRPKKIGNYWVIAETARALASQRGPQSTAARKKKTQVKARQS